MRNNKVLFVFANQFPYGNGETYMEAEMKYWDKFEKIYIFSLQLRKKNLYTVRRVADNVAVIPVRFNVLAYLAYFFVALTDMNVYYELLKLIKTKRLSIRSIAQLLVYVSRSHYESSLINKALKGETFENVVFYSYRFGYQPYVACLLKEKMHINCDIYSRAHRYDLYENRKKTHYIPLREYLLKHLKRCFPVSNNGTEYLKKCYPLYSQKIETRYLGTVDHGVTAWIRGDVFKIVSCSNVVPVKRINLIIEALALMKDYKIEWTHYGNGALLDKMKDFANKELPSNVNVNWRGSVKNQEILNDYKTKCFNLFLNVSSSEGIPVSIMEANSFGIPCVATDVGGTNELIENTINGILLSSATNAQEIAASIVEFITMTDEYYDTYCRNARRIWKERFSAEKNYTNFINGISNG